jgi:uncharacterized protein DUF6529
VNVGQAPAPGRRLPLVAALLLAAGVSVGLGVLGRAHQPGIARLPTFGFSDEQTFKAWLATAVLVLAAAQLLSALWIYRRLPGLGRPPRRLPATHRACGAVAFTLSLPVAAYCLYSFGFAPNPMSTRILLHSVAGCAFYGAFAGKVLLVHTRRIPSWSVPPRRGAAADHRGTDLAHRRHVLVPAHRPAPLT